MFIGAHAAATATSTATSTAPAPTATSTSTSTPATSAGSTSTPIHALLQQDREAAHEMTARELGILGWPSVRCRPRARARAQIVVMSVDNVAVDVSCIQCICTGT